MFNIVISLLLYSFLFSESQSSIIDLIQIEGNIKTKEYIILREIKQQLNNPWSNESIIEDKNRIYNLGLFSSVQIDVITNEENKNIYMITVSEMWYIWPFPIIKYDNQSSEFSYGIGMMHNNYRGRDENIALGATLGNIREYFLWYENPWISGNHNSLEIGFYNESSDHHVYNIIEKDNGFFTEGGFQKGSNHKFNFWINYNNKLIQIWHPLDGSDIVILESDELIKTDFSYFKLGYQYKYDTRDVYIDPNSGSFLNIELINAFGLDDTENIHEMEFQFNTYKKLFESYWNPIFKYKFLTNIQYSNVNIPIFKKNYIGGQGYVRGYSAIPSQNSFSNSREMIEVDNFIINSFEVQSTLINRKEYIDKIEMGMDIVFFADWGLGYDINQNPAKSNSLFGYGLGVRIFLMGGVIKLDYGFNIQGSSRWHVF